MQLEQRIYAFTELGKFLSQFSSEISTKRSGITNNDSFYDEMLATLTTGYLNNNWFTKDNLAFACKSWSEALTKENLQQWISKYKILETNTASKTIAIVMAGNIPLVGFHDFLSVLITGNNVLVKLSSNDAKLLPFLTAYLISVEPAFKETITFTEKKLENFDAVIATGSNNTSLYFDHYFGKYPNIIRKNRNSIAILTGQESPEQMETLANDVFRYFGLGCRNVSKIYVPKTYDWDHFFNGMYAWKEVINNHKYMNNYDYNKAVYLMSNIKLLDNEFMLLKEDTGFSSPISVVFYERYESVEKLKQLLTSQDQNIQCIVSKEHIPFGVAQSPNLWDYADDVDTVAFILSL